MNHRKSPRRPSPARHVEPLENRRLLAAATLNFEAAPPGLTSAAGYSDPAGYTFTGPDATGSDFGLEPLVVYGPEKGFASKVVQSRNFGRAVRLRRTAGGTFSLSGFDYGAAVYGAGGDFTVTANFADGTTQSRAVSFTSKTPTRLATNWTNLTSVLLNYAGGVERLLRLAGQLQPSTTARRRGRPSATTAGRRSRCRASTGRASTRACRPRTAARS